MINNLEFITVDNPVSMAELFAKTQLFETYLECFSEPPYEEYFTAEEVEKLFKNYADKGLIIFCLDQEIYRCAGFLAAVPLAKNEAVAAIAAENGLAINDYWFIEEVGVGKAYRKHQIFSDMESELRKKIDVPKLLSRTKTINEASLAAHKKLGYEIIPNMTQRIEYQHLSGEIRSDDRVFMECAIK